MGGVIASAGRFYSIAAEKSDLPSYFAATKSLVADATLALAGMALLLMFGMYWYGCTHWLTFTIAALVFAASSGNSALLNSIQNAARLRALVASHSCLDPWLKLVFAIGFMLWLGNTSTAVVSGYAVSSILLSGSQWYFLGRAILPSRNPALLATNVWRQPMRIYAWPFSVWGVFTWLQQASDRWALQHFVGESGVGMYTVVFQLGFVPIGLITTMAITLIGPILYQRVGGTQDTIRNNSGHRLAWVMTGLSLAATGLAFFVALLLHKWLFKLFVAENYSTASYLLPWVILAGGLFSAGQILALKLMSEMRPESMTVVKVTTAIGGVGLNIWCASYFGIAGVVASLVIFSFVYCIWMAWLARHSAVLDVLRVQSPHLD
ncbi:MAG: hypothetical protein IPF38_18860 [Burkholderiales bacterium]|nr:hypothetical protein [Burkholderiales bacterium]